MGLSRAKEISASGIAAEAMHMELIASNIANINSTKTIDGGVYQRKIMQYFEKPLSFAEQLSSAEKRMAEKGSGVGFKVVNDETGSIQKVYNPGHPDADEQGYVTTPNISMATEMTDMVYTQKLSEANVAAYNSSRKMSQDILQIQ